MSPVVPYRLQVCGTVMWLAVAVARTIGRSIDTVMRWQGRQW